MSIVKGFRFGLLLQLAVGPICLFIFQAAASTGVLSAMYGVAGVAVIDALYILAAIVGLGAVFDRYKKSKQLMGIFGGGLLVVFGLQMVLSLIDISILPDLQLFNVGQGHHVGIQVMLLTLSNPLTILFWAGVFSSKLSEIEKSETYLYGFGAVLSTIVFLTIVAFIGHFIGVFINELWLNALNGLVGLVLIVFGIRTCVKTGLKH